MKSARGFLSMVRSTWHGVYLYPGFSVKVAFGLQTIYFLFNIYKAFLGYGRQASFITSWTTLGVILLSYLSILLFIQAVHLLTRWNRGLNVFSHLLLMILYFLFISYSLISGGEFDYKFIHDNFTDIFYKESWQVLNTVILKPLILMAVLIPLLLLWEKRRRVLSGWPLPLRPRFALAITLLGLGSYFLFALPSYDPLTHFAQSIVDYHFSPLPIDIRGLPPFPLINKAPGAPAAGARPHVFLVMIESFNANMVDGRDNQGREITPVFNRLRDQGTYFSRFHANGIQTFSGQLAVLCSLLPALYGKVSSSFQDVRLHGLPEIMDQSGFHTLYFNAAVTNTFDNTELFMKKIGFQAVAAMDGRFVRAEDADKVWGWGLQDDRFYQKVFQCLDETIARDPGRPTFTVLNTISSHMKWDKVPARERELFPEPKTPEERYLNAIHLADRCLGTFLDELRRRPVFQDSLVILTGDHSFPMGEHHNFFNEVGCYEESFRTPLLMIWPGKIAAGKRSDLVCSQLDLAPTLLNLLGIRADNHFLGTDIFTLSEDDRRIIPMLQSYDGIYLVSLQWPWKYAKHLRTGQEFFFNLENDPLEMSNLIHEAGPDAHLARLRRSQRIFYLTQFLFEHDRIWPPSRP
jgi:arylsulfatase A-like enzyme